MTKPPKATSVPDYRQPAVVPAGNHHVPAWWVDEFPDRVRLIEEAKATVRKLGPGPISRGYPGGYDAFTQTVAAAECGAAATWYLLRSKLRLR